MLEALWLLKSQIQWLVLLALILLALWRGGAPERQAAFVFVGVFVADRLYHWILPAGAHLLRVDFGHILIDSIALAFFMVIALRANRIYPLWLASFQLMTIVSHIEQAISPTIHRGAYAVLAFAPSYLEIAVFGIGIFLHLRRQAKFGQYQSWQNS